MPQPFSFPFSLCTLTALLLLAGGVVQSEEPTPLVSNPGFENGLADWQVDNWAHNEISVTADAAHPHSGKQCARIELKKIINEANLQFASGPLALHADRAIEIRFWARGVSNTSAITTMLRRSDAPYTKYFRSDSTLSDEWREFSYIVTIPKEATTSPISLRFWLNAPGVFWLDDVSVRELPAASQAPAPTANPVRNASFETGIDGWAATIREREFPEAYQESGSNAPCVPDAQLESIESSDSPHGRHHLEFTVPDNGYASLTSAYFTARYGHQARVSLMLRGTVPAEVTLGIGGGKNGNARYQNTTVACTTAWQRVTCDAMLKPVEGGAYCLQLGFTHPGRYAIDDVQVIEDGANGLIAHPPSAALVATSEIPAGQLYNRGQQAGFDLTIADSAPDSAASWRWQVEDHRDHLIAGGTLDLTTDHDGRVTIPFTVPTDRYGAFRISARRADSPTVLAEQLYSVLPELPAPTTHPDSYFGGHVDFTPYNLELARRAGFRWLRLHPPMSTKWMVVEPTPGTWIFHTATIEAAHRQGFRVLGSLDTAPLAASVADPERTKPPRWCRSYPPADLAAWQHYVTQTVRAFGTSIDAWELWNEPDGDFLQVPRGMDKTRVYLDLLAATRQALDSVAPATVLIGPALATPSAPFGSAILTGGGGAKLDAFSFHCYALTAGGASPDDVSLLPLIERWHGFTDRHGQPLAVWHSEGGIWLPGGQSRLTTWGIPESSSLTPAQGAAAMVRAALLFKAAGVKRYFDFQAWASPAGRRVSEDNCCGFIEVTGIPGAGLAAHAAMVALTEDGVPDGFHVSPVASGGNVREARFRAANGRVSAWWGDATVPLATLVPAGTTAWDLMGNALPLEQAQTGEYPVYTLQPAP